LQLFGATWKVSEARTTIGKQREGCGITAELQQRAGHRREEGETRYRRSHHNVLELVNARITKLYWIGEAEDGVHLLNPMAFDNNAKTDGPKAISDQADHMGNPAVSS